ncbi:Nif3-like dinuclear metal center hexameric protein [Clostridium sp. D2Q-11]|uniref:GTP cyclohydrolase 1 type 2 homolog n=1 Tax=Anaeromonas frigoriresistens TaxID=2683708 RepID=A0A942UT43_9FIRM|nr:Nif3-like dinuclear metal center hexameric protein [Anaeromonas frigoriresistens]MBS4536920.1 Nif3-like dinuclear metal center hexameric protein [Anaeromonas frigoriresistens]
MITSKDVIRKLEEIAPKKLAEKWDNVGLQIGSREKRVNKILLALDVTLDVVQEAIDNEVDMIVSHHPIFFSPIKSVDYDSYRGQLIKNIIKNDIIVYTAHTNLDSSNRGVSDALIEELDIKPTGILSKVYKEKLYKLVVFVPETHEEALRGVLGGVGAGSIGNYSNCSFTSKGTGRFKPEDGADPYIGSIDEIEKVQEVKIEVIVSEDKLNKVVEEMISAHPYEEVAYDIIRLENTFSEYGTGRVGYVEKTTLGELAKYIKRKLNTPDIRVYGELDESVERVAVSGGEGSDFIKDAKRANVDVYITGDIKHHMAQIATELGVNIIDAGHFYTEKIVMKKLAKYFEGEFSKDIEVLISEKDNIAKYYSL